MNFNVFFINYYTYQMVFTYHKRTHPSLFESPKLSFCPSTTESIDPNHSFGRPKIKQSNLILHQSTSFENWMKIFVEKFKKWPLEVFFKYRFEIRLGRLNQEYWTINQSFIYDFFWEWKNSFLRYLGTLEKFVGKIFCLNSNSYLTFYLEKHHKIKIQ